MFALDTGAIDEIFLGEIFKVSK